MKFLVKVEKINNISDMYFFLKLDFYGYKDKPYSTYNL